MKTRFTVSPHGDGYAVFDDGEFHEAPATGTWGAAKKIADKLNDGERTVRMKYGAMLAKDSKVLVTGPEYIVERKWDGMRAIFEIQEGETFIFSRSGQDLRPQFPELVRLHEILPECILDGEIVALDENGVEQLELLQMRSGDKNARMMSQIPVTVKFFDILENDGQDVRGQSLEMRRQILKSTVGPNFVVELLPEGQEIPSHWEGTISKLASSRYESGKRRASWSKWKFVNRATLVATGLTPGKGSRSSSFGAVIVADANGIVRGQVGSGFTAADIDILVAHFDRGNPFPLFIEVEYRFLSKTGLMVNTAYKGIRDDKDAADAL